MPSSITSDPDVQQFLTTNNPSTFVQPSTSFLVGNICAGTQQLTASQAEDQEVTQDPESYISGVVAFIENANINDVIEKTLLSSFTTEYNKVKQNTASLVQQGNNSSNGSQQDGTSNATYEADVVDSISSSYASLIFGTGSVDNAAPGTCAHECKNLPLAEQATCEFQCVKSCVV